MDNFEKLVKHIMKECETEGLPLTEAEAVEMAEMELKATKNRASATEGDIRERKPRTVKKDPEKIEIISKIYNFLLTNGYPNATIINEQREIKFNDFSVTLTKHRIKKG